MPRIPRTLPAFLFPALLAATEAAAQAPRPLPLTLTPRATTEALTEADLMSRIYLFAHDSMMGRSAGTEGNRRANAYIVRELERIGLRPAGENGGWYQDVPLVLRDVEEGAEMRVGGEALARNTDFAPVTTRGSLRTIDGTYPVVFGGMLEEMGTLTREEVEGKLVVIAARPGPVRGQHPPPDAPLASAAGIFIAALDRVPAAQRAGLWEPSLGLPSTVFGSGPVPQAIFITAAAAEKMLGAPLAGLARGAAGRTIQARLRIVERPRPSQNVVALLPGSDPVLGREMVALVAHADHHGVQAAAVDHDSIKSFFDQRRAVFVALDEDADGALTPEQDREYQRRSAAIMVDVDSLRRIRPARRDSIMNGADDNATGAMTLLEVAEELAARREKPRRSVLFVWHTAEERGMLGSRWFTSRSTVPRDAIVANVNLDQIGRGSAADQRNGGPDYLNVIGSRRLSSQLDSVLVAVNARQPRPFLLDRALDRDAHPLNIYCRSDHAEFARWGIPSVALFTGLHADYHQVTDEPQYVDYARVTRVAGYARDAVVALANLDQRPVVDRPKPDPARSCRQ